MHEELTQQDKRVVGTKQLLRGLEKGTIKTVYLAKDADEFMYRRVLNAAEAANVPVIKVDAMKELGKMCGIEVKTAAAGILL